MVNASSSCWEIPVRIEEERIKDIVLSHGQPVDIISISIWRSVVKPADLRSQVYTNIMFANSSRISPVLLRLNGFVCIVTIVKKINKMF